MRLDINDANEKSPSNKQFIRFFSHWIQQRETYQVAYIVDMVAFQLDLLEFSASSCCLEVVVITTAGSIRVAMVAVNCVLLRVVHLQEVTPYVTQFFMFSAHFIRYFTIKCLGLIPSEHVYVPVLENASSRMIPALHQRAFQFDPPIGFIIVPLHRTLRVSEVTELSHCRVTSPSYHIYVPVVPNSMCEVSPLMKHKLPFLKDLPV